MPLFPKLPSRVKPSELTMINPVWIDIHTDPKEFVPHKTVTFLWVMRDDGHIILGVEEPWKYKEAFAESVWPMLDKMREHYQAQTEYYKTQSIRDGSGGHPTLAAWFDPSGKASCHAGFAYIGGELKYDAQEKYIKPAGWVLTNESGRFGRAEEIDKTVTVQEVQEVMTAAAQRIKDQTGLDAKIYIRK